MKHGMWKFTVVHYSKCVKSNILISETKRNEITLELSTFGNINGST